MIGTKFYSDKTGVDGSPDTDTEVITFPDKVDDLIAQIERDFYIRVGGKERGCMRGDVLSAKGGWCRYDKVTCCFVETFSDHLFGLFQFIQNFSAVIKEYRTSLS